jgi:hypothetical protein
MRSVPAPSALCDTLTSPSTYSPAGGARFPVTREAAGGSPQYRRAVAPREIVERYGEWAGLASVHLVAGVPRETRSYARALATKPARVRATW